MFDGSLVAIVTPMRADGAIDWRAWEALLEMHEAAGTAGIVVGGTTGESPTVELPELRELVARARAVLGKRLTLAVGASSSSTAAAVAAAQQWSAADVDALLVATPAYNKPTQEGLYRHFEAVAMAARVPLILYNVPGRTAVDMLPATVARLAQVPGVAAIKEAVASMDRIRELLRLTAAPFAVLSGDDATATEALLLGARGVISVTANAAPGTMAQMCAAARRGEADLARRINEPLCALHEALFVESNPIPVKWAMEYLGMINGALRLPLTELSEQHRDLVRRALETAGLGQLPARVRTA